jgi:hypothetical protein
VLEFVEIPMQSTDQKKNPVGGGGGSVVVPVGGVLSCGLKGCYWWETV